MVSTSAPKTTRRPPTAMSPAKSSKNGSRSTIIQSAVVGLTVYLAPMVANLIAHHVIVHRTNDPSAPLVLERTEDFLTPEDMEALMGGLRNQTHMLTKPDSLNDWTVFGSSRGFVVRFNAEGVDRFRADKRYAPMVPLFDRLRANESNAFVMNVLVIPPTPAQRDAGNASHTPHAIGCHIDQDVAIRVPIFVRTFTAHEVNVLYASVPDHMVGGELELHPFLGGIPGHGAVPEQVVMPASNTLVRFRGDAYHCVRPHFDSPAHKECVHGACALDGARVSVVLEQYRIPSGWYRRTRVFEEESSPVGGY
mmetsp:Transcript_2926/g.8652  ORF Transcript_2926/g.8652 Transcript_2926/m.8652 type:complete len:308 (-) Transcript_2926:179-1102(-)